MRSRNHRRGAALLYATIVVVLMGGLCLALTTTTLSTGRQRVETELSQRSFYAAEAGLSDAYMRMTEGAMELPAEGVAQLGSREEPLPLGAAGYWVAIRPLDSRSYELRATGIDGRREESLRLLLSEKPTGFFQYAAFGAESVVLDSNAFIDSYDSARGDYESQIVGGNGWALESGNVGSNSDILMKANTEVHGDVTPGPGHVVDDSAPNVFISGSTDPAEEPTELPPIEIPPIPSLGSLVGDSEVSLGPGDVHYDSILMKGGGTLTIQGPATLVVDDFEMLSNSKLVFETADGPVKLYATADFVLESNSVVQTLSDSALDVMLFLNGNNMTKKPADSLRLSANSSFIGAIYAPNAYFKLASNFNVYGSIMCGALHLSSFGEIHFDEALLYDGWGASGEYERVYWSRAPRQ